MSILSSRLSLTGLLSLFTGNTKTIRWLSPEENFMILANDPVDIPLIVKEYNLPLSTLMLIDGEFPDGVSLDQEGRRLTGEILNKTSAVYTFTLRAYSEGYSADRTFSLLVKDENYEFIWITPAGLIDADYENSIPNIQLLAYDSLGLPIKYNREFGPVPNGTRFRDDGTLEGFYEQVDADHHYRFTASAFNGYELIQREFQITVWDSPGLGAPEWATPKGPLADLYEDTIIDQFLRADPTAGGEIKYRIEYGSEPTGSTFDTTTGHVYGLLDEVEDDERHIIIVAASSDNWTTSSKRMFEVLVRQNWPPEWPEGDIIYRQVEGYPYEDAYLIATDRNAPDQSITYNYVSGLFPETVTFDPYTGLISGNAPPHKGDDDNREPDEYPVVIQAHDSLKFTDKSVMFISVREMPPIFHHIGPAIDIGDASGDGKSAASRVEYVGLEMTQLTTRERPAYDGNGKPLTYRITGGTIPDGFSFDPNTGQISGTLPPAPTEDIIFEFVITASNRKESANQFVRIISWTNTTPTFSITSLRIGLEGKVYSDVIEAVDRERQPLNYTLIGGNAPETIYLDSQGRVSGIMPMLPTQEDAEYDLIVEASDGVLSVIETIKLVNQKNRPPVWVTEPDELEPVLGQKTFRYTLVAEDPNDQEVYYQILSRSKTVNGNTVIVPKFNDIELFNFNTATGVMTGRFPHTYDSGDITYTITVAALDGDHPHQLYPSVIRTFTFTALENKYPVWVTPSLFWEGDENTTITKPLLGYDPEGEPVRYWRYNNLIARWGYRENLRSISLVGDTVTGGLPQSVDRDKNIFFTVHLDDMTRSSPDYYRVARQFVIKVLYAKAPRFTVGPLLFKRVEDTLYSFQMRATNLGNAESMLFRLVSGTLPEGMSMSPDGLISGRLPLVSNADKTYTFEIEADNTTKTTTETFQIIVEKNLAPYWSTPAGSIGEFYANNLFGIQLVAIDPNENRGYPLQYTANDPLPAGVNLTINGYLSGKFAIEEFGETFEFSVRVFDGMYHEDRTFSITRLDNAPPIILSNGVIGTPHDTSVVNIPIRVRDPENEPLDYQALTPLPDGLTLDSTTGVISGTVPDIEEDAEYPFLLQVKDSYHTVTKNLTIKATNNLPPEWVSHADNAKISGVGGDALTIRLEAVDPNGDEVTYLVLSADNGISRVAVNENILTVYSYREDPAVLHNLVIGASDGVFITPLRLRIEFLKNTPPEWTTPEGVIMVEPVNAEIDFQFEATDGETSLLTYVIQGEYPAGLVFENGRLHGTIAYGLPKVYRFTVVVSDGHWETNRSFQIEVTNDEPEWETDELLGEFNEFEQVAVQLTAVDPEGADVTYRISEVSMPDYENPDDNILVEEMNFTITPDGFLTGIVPRVFGDGFLEIVVEADDGYMKSYRAFLIKAIFISPPAWISFDNVGGGPEQTPYEFQLRAKSGNDEVVYRLVEGLLPTSLSVRSDGLLSGMLPPVTGDTVFDFEVEAISLVTNKVTSKIFSISVDENLAPVWLTPAELPSVKHFETRHLVNFEAMDPNGETITYNMVSGNPPWPIVFNEDYTTAHMVGSMPDLVEDAHFEFTIGAYDGFINTERRFRITALANKAPVWSHEPQKEPFEIKENTTEYLYLRATDETKLTYSIISDTFPTLPNGNRRVTLMSPDSSVVTIRSPIVNGDTEYTLTIRADDGKLHTDSTVVVKVKNDNRLHDPYSQWVKFLAPAENIQRFDVVGTKTATYHGSFANTSDKPHNSQRSFFGATNITTPTYAEFDGGDDFRLDQLEEWSLDVWLYQSTTSSTQHPLVIGDINGNWAGIELISDNVAFKVVTGAGPLSYIINIGKIIEGRWFHVLVTKSKDNKITTYLDGKVTSTRSNSPIGELSSTVRFLGSGNPVTNWFGYGDDLRMTHAVREKGENFSPTARAPWPPKFSTLNNSVVSIGAEMAPQGEVISVAGVHTDPEAVSAEYFAYPDAISGINRSDGKLTFDRYPIAYGATTDHKVPVHVVDSHGNLSAPIDVIIRSSAAWSEAVIAQWRMVQDDAITLSTKPVVHTGGSGVPQAEGFVQTVSPITFTSEAPRDIVGDFTLDFWMKTDDISNGMVLKVSDIEIMFEGGELKTGDGLVGEITPSEWQHVVVERLGTSVTLYINGRASGISQSLVDFASTDIIFNGRGIATGFRGVTLYSLAKYKGEFVAEYPNFGDDGVPKWITDPILPEVVSGEYFEFTLKYRDLFNKIDKNTIIGTAPDGMDYDKYTGVLRGVVYGEVGSEHHMYVILRGNLHYIPRVFTIKIKEPVPPVKWVTPPVLGTISGGEGFHYVLRAEGK